MTVTYLGSLTTGSAIPGASALAAAGAAGIGLALPDIEARLAGLLAFTPTPIDLTANLAIAQQVVTSLQLSISLGITPPDISAQLAIVAALVADLTASVLSVNAQLAIILGFDMSAAGVHAYRYDGPANQLGSEFSTELSGGFPAGAPTDATNAVLLATTIPATWTVLQTFLKTAP